MIHTSIRFRIASRTLLHPPSPREHFSRLFLPSVFLLRVPSSQVPLATFRREHHLPGFWPSSRHHQSASTALRFHEKPRGSQPSLRSVLRCSQPLDGFLRTSAGELVSSHSRVQDLHCSGASLFAQPHRLVADHCPLAVVEHTLTGLPSGHVCSPRPRGFAPCEAALHPVSG